MDITEELRSEALASFFDIDHRGRISPEMTKFADYLDPTGEKRPSLPPVPSLISERLSGNCANGLMCIVFRHHALRITSVVAGSRSFCGHGTTLTLTIVAPRISMTGPVRV